MNNRAAVLCLLIVCFGLAACKPSNVENAKYGMEVSRAMAELNRHWSDIYLEGSKAGLVTDGYLEIKNTRVITLKDGASNQLGQNGIRLIVEFVLFSDYYGASPYYFNLPMYDTIAIFEDGRVEVQPTNLFRVYFSQTFSNDFSHIIESIEDLGSAFNVIMKLQ